MTRVRPMYTQGGFPIAESSVLGSRVALGKNAKIELLKRVPLFAGCSKAELREVALSADELDLREGYVLTREGKPGREFFVLIEGTARVSKDDEDDRRLARWRLVRGDRAPHAHSPHRHRDHDVTGARSRGHRSRVPPGRRDDAEDRAQGPRDRRPAARARRQKLGLGRVQGRAAAPVGAPQGVREAASPLRIRAAN